jgi:uncharacterized RDD family membrane protein YckC/predicted Zn-dependent protease
LKRRFAARRPAVSRRAAAFAVAVPAVLATAYPSLTGASPATIAVVGMIGAAFGLVLACVLRRSAYVVSANGITVTSGPVVRRTPWQRVLAVAPEAERVRVLLVDGNELLLTPRDTEGLVDALRAHARVLSRGGRLDDPWPEQPLVASTGPAVPAMPDPAGSGGAACAKCHAAAPAGAMFCANCGAPVAEASRRGKAVVLGGRLYRLATFRRRLAASMVDGAIFSFAYQLLGTALVMGSGRYWGAEGLSIPLDLGFFAVGFAAAWASDWIGQTPGKRLLGLRVIRYDGHRPGPVHGLVRTQLRIVSMLPLFLGYLWAIWDGRKQTWHDKFASTCVVRADEDFAYYSASVPGGPRVRAPLFAGRSAVLALPVAGLIAVGSLASVFWASSLPDLQAAGDLRIALPATFRAVHPLPPPERLRDASLARPVHDEGCPGPAKRLCLIPLDDAAEADVVALAAYFREMYDIDTYAMRPLGLEGREAYPGQLVVDEEREQLDGHSAVELMQRLYPNTIGLGTATVIGVTSYDIASRQVPTYRFMYSARDTTLRLVLVSTARLEPVAWGEAPDEDLRMSRVRKIVAREVGLMYYALPHSDDPRSVLQLTLSPLERLDAVDEELPRDQLAAELGERIEAGWTWEGRSATRTRVFELGAGEWEYCARLIGASTSGTQAGFRVSAYAEDGTWLVSRGGQGVSGSIGCVPLVSAPGRFYLIVWTSSADVAWSVRVRRSSLGDPLSVRTLPEWDRYPSAVAPAAATDERFVFESSGTQATSQFPMPDATWSFCWEVTAALSDRTDVGPLQFSVFFEDEITVGEEHRIENATPGDAGCVLVDGPQPGRYRVLVGAPRRPAWRLTIATSDIELARAD